MRELAGLIAFAAWSVFGMVGCGCHTASTGWRFEVGRPAVFSSPGLVQQMSGGLALSPLGTTIPPILTGTTAQAGAVQLMNAAPPVEVAPLPRRMAAPAPAAPDCTCEQLLSILQRIDSKLTNLGAKKLGPGPELE
jgi:hypothetical protein